MLQTWEQIEREAIEDRLAHFRGNRYHAAKSLRISVRTLQRKAKKYRLPEGIRGYHGTMTGLTRAAQVNQLPEERGSAGGGTPARPN